MTEIKNSYLIFILVLCNLILYYLTNEFLITDTLIKDHYSNQLSYDRILKLISIKNEWSWVNYLLIPALQLIELSIVSFWILCGSIIFNLNITYKSIFKIVMIADFIWLLPSFFSLVWFGLFDTSHSLLEIQYFAPLSLLSIYDPSQLDSWLIFPLKSINIFEFIYLLVLALGIKKITSKDYDSALKFTLPVYGSALIVWILFITFLSINMTA
ncbi:hypothetical protein QYS49_19440 [Marivirga salinae]|uniref:Uncharacterized protein n=1 Tax=Marivirga salinarum TaxID=3059078 RepID=A0AA49JGI7_9BACT|nr:hypothetical protein [Marivirga sp. BDSF4-3]WKK73995.2 hypothetical protein QYS49_19440 [Marivirga sp. BDSF4-3]